ncbi:MAG: PFL family protein [Armatimonadetes bacterium]|nr:PFL family protein [Armatimonadota bacterium]
MLPAENILTTVRMLQDEHLDVRAVTLGIDLFPCADRDPDTLCRLARERILRCAGGIQEACQRTAQRYGIPIVNRRIAISPAADLLAGHSPEALLHFAQMLDAVAEETGVDFIGGYSAQVQKGMTSSDRALIESLPAVLSDTTHVCASVNAASSHAGINMDALLLLGRVIREMAERTAERDGFACAKLCLFANQPEDNPFMAGAYRGIGEPECVVNIGVSGPGVVKRAIERARQSGERLSLGDIAEEIKLTAFRVTRVGELIGREVAALLGAEFGIVDLSLAPTPEIGDSVGEILEVMGVRHVGGPGSTAALALLNDAVKKGGAFASSSVGGLSGAFIPVAEDAALAAAVEAGHLRLEKLEAMTAVCSVGLDMIALPGDTSAETLAALAADELAIGVVNRKTTAVRLVPVPGKRAGERAVFGGLFGESPILAVPNGASDAFVALGGRIPAPLVSLNN